MFLGEHCGGYKKKTLNCYYHQKLIFIHTLIAVSIEHIESNTETGLRFWKNQIISFEFTFFSYIIFCFVRLRMLNVTINNCLGVEDKLNKF